MRRVLIRQYRHAAPSPPEPGKSPQTLPELLLQSSNSRRAIACVFLSEEQLVQNHRCPGSECPSMTSIAEHNGFPRITPDDQSHLAPIQVFFFARSDSCNLS